MRHVLEHNFGEEDETAETWIHRRVLEAQRGKTVRFPIKLVEAVTDGLQQNTTAKTNNSAP